MADRPRVLVAGAGAIGSVVGGLLAQAGWPVTLLGRAAHMTATARQGLHVEGLFGIHHVHGITCATDVAQVRGPFAVVLLAVKAWDTGVASLATAPLLARDGVMISMQNGLGNIEQVARAVGPSRTLGGRVLFGAETPEPGRVRVTVCAEPVMIGSPDPHDAARMAAAGTWAAALATAGVPAESTERILAVLWAKVLYNAALNPLGALLGVPYGWLANDPDTRATMDVVIDEAFRVACAEGVALAWPDADGYREAFYGRLVPLTAGHRSSMLQDLERGRPTEIDAINGWVAQRGAVLGVATPVNAALTRIVRARVRRQAERSEP